jgi:hypothetical protein
MGRIISVQIEFWSGGIFNSRFVPWEGFEILAVLHMRNRSARHSSYDAGTDVEAADFAALEHPVNMADAGPPSAAQLHAAYFRIAPRRLRQACRSGVVTTRPSSSSVTRIWHDRREFSRTS